MLPLQRFYHVITRLSLLCVFAGGLSVPLSVNAIPARRTGDPLPAAAAGMENCVESIRRFNVGPGRRPGATVVPVTLRLQVKDRDGQFIEASADRTKAFVSGDKLSFKAIVNNLSLYDVGNVVITHAFDPSRTGPKLDQITDVKGATYNERLEAFVIGTIPSDDSVTFTFTLLLSGNLDADLSQSQIRLEDFEVLESERRLPERTPETPSGRSSQTLEKVGIGGTDVACYTWEGDTRIVASTQTRTTTANASATVVKRVPGPPYLVTTGAAPVSVMRASVTPLIAQYSPPTSSSSSSSSVPPAGSASPVMPSSPSPSPVVSPLVTQQQVLMPVTGVDLKKMDFILQIVGGILGTLFFFYLSFISMRLVSRKWLGGGE